MKNLVLMSVMALGALSAQAVHSQSANCCCDQNSCCDPQCYEQPTGECYCRYVRYQPKSYCKPRCVEEKIPYCETKCRYVPQYYEVQKCRYVPQYYTETRCRQVPEYYKVQKCATRTRTEYDRYYYYTPECTYWKRAACTDNQNACPTCPTCPNNQGVCPMYGEQNASSSSKK